MTNQTTNVSLDMLEDRKWLMVNMPITSGDVTAALINSAVKYSVQRHILKRQAEATKATDAQRQEGKR